MYLSSDQVYIINPLGGPPQQGLFAVRLGRGTLDRALSVQQAPTKLWSAFLDGFPCATPSEHWMSALGRIYESCQGLLIGRRLERSEYNRLIRTRLMDTHQGVDVSKPINLNHVRTPF